MAEKERQEEVW